MGNEETKVENRWLRATRTKQSVRREKINVLTSSMQQNNKKTKFKTYQNVFDELASRDFSLKTISIKSRVKID